MTTSTYRVTTRRRLASLIRRPRARRWFGSTRLVAINGSHHIVFVTGQP